MSPLSQSQKGIYYACLDLDGKKGDYQVPVLFKLPESIDVLRLKTALEQVIRAHPYILSRLVFVEGEAYMEEGQFEEVPVIEADEALMGKGLCRVMDLTKDRLYRFEIYRTRKAAYFFMDIHHIILDGMSMLALTDDIKAAYDGLSLEPEPIDGAAVALQEVALRQSDQWTLQKEWYLGEFAEASETGSLPVPENFEGDTSQLPLVETNYDVRVKADYISGLCERYDVRESVLFTMAWGKMLANFTAEDKAFFTTIYHGRTDRQTRRTVAMMVRTLPVYISFKSDSKVADVLTRLKYQQHQAREKSAYSFADIHAELSLKGESMFAYQGTIAPSADFPLTLGGRKLAGKDLRSARPGTILDGQLYFVKDKSEESDYVIRISYDSALYSAGMICGMVDSFVAVLKSLGTADTVADIEATTPGQQTVLDGFNPEKAMPFPEGRTVIDCFKDSCAAHPDNDCCIFLDRKYTYRQIDCITDALAARIQQLVGKPSGQSAVVSFIIPRCELMLILPIAIQKAGYTYQPLDPSYPTERLSFMSTDADSKLLVVTPEYDGLLPDFKGEVLVIDDLDLYARSQAQPQAVSFKPDDCFVLIYTSGTTGQPKGVMVTQRNVFSFCCFNVPYLRMDHNSRYASYASYGFDPFMMDLWTTMTAGAALVIISEDIRLDLQAIKECFEKNAVTHACLTTQVGTQLVINYPKIGCLEEIGLGGEKLVSLDPPAYRLINMYGPTENTVYVTSYDVTRNEKNIPIGHATANSRIYVVNKEGKRVPPGAAGELWTSGSQIALGYLNQPEKTAAVFLPNPFVSGDELKAFPTVYRTGDIVRFRMDGEVEFIGRKDGQVKVRGFRIELKEVESVIRDFPDVREVTVQAFEQESGGKAIAAYVVMSEGTLDVEALNDFILEHKPPYMVPSVTMQLDSIPVNVNGKVDKRRLPKPQLSVAASGSSNTPTAPLNLLEQELTALVQPFTDCKDFPITTPLVYLGLTSIGSLKLSMELMKRFGVNVSSKELIHGASLQSIENVILEALLNKDSQELQLQVAAVETTFDAPLSNAQFGIYFECMKNVSSTVYNIPQRITFPQSVTSERLKKAVEQAIKSHPSLFARMDGSVDPVMQRADCGVTPLVSISDKSVDDLAAAFVQPFDLTHGPLYRAVISGHTLFLDVHHLVMDGSSISILLHQICDALEGKEVQMESYSYFDYVRDEQSCDSSEAESFFKEQLSSVEEATSLPADLSGKEQDGKAAELCVELSHDQVSRFARSRGVTPASVYLSAVEYLAGRYANTKDICICTVSSGRNPKNAETAGMFVNTLALVSHISDVTVGEYVDSVADSFSRTLENENYPFARISRDFGISPELVFIYQLGLIDKFSVKGEMVRMETMDLSAPKFKAAFLVEERNGKVMLVCQYNDALYSNDMIERMLDSLVQVIRNMVSAPDEKISRLSIISPRQREELEPMRCIGYMDLPQRLFHKGIESRVDATPDKLAIIATDRSLTYKQFDLQANKIANALLAKGLQKGDAVVALLPRDSNTPCCIFGIMKAGGAFITCDPEYPTDRIKLIAEDSEAAFVVTTAELVANYGDRGICIEELASYEDDSRPEIEMTKDDLAYMIYTSGSTGKPKGVMVSHGNITVVLTDSEMNPHHSLVASCSRMINVATISFDAFVLEFGYCTFNGSTFVFANEREAKDPVALAALMQRTGADYFGCTCSRMLQYLELPEFVSCLKNCHAIIQGGEKFSEALLKRLKELCPDADILNGYGPTEVAITCNTWNLRNEDTVSVGKPMPNFTEWILDKDGNELPVGVTGELCAGGEAITQGYRNLPEKTAEKYINYGGMRAFKTGDYARWRPDGKVEILGRADNQVKLRGLRIELGEVETAIGKCEGVTNVLAMICTIGGREHLCAYFTADHVVDIEEMKSSIGKTLTSYMVPTAYLQMDAFPVTPNGKTDFRHLPPAKLSFSQTDYVAAANDAEQFFADCFARVLGLDKVSVTDNFFSIGGTSLVVMRVVIDAQKAGYKVTYSDVFDRPTARGLASLTAVGEQADSDPDKDIKDYDYTGIDALLAGNTLENYLKEPALRPLGSVLLTGATGFLGIHIFRQLLEQYPDSEIHCLLRSKHGISGADRLNQLLFYYFEKDMSELLGKRVFVHEADVTSAISLDAHIDTVINCAAIVKHFASGTVMDEVNVGGARNCIDFCLARGARLVQISTYSVGGASVDGKPGIGAFTESMLYKGQRLHNQYIHSKLMAERLILEAAINRGLDCKIMRLGNLSARSEDGEFQINVKTSSFMGRLRIYQMLGAVPYSSYQSPIEFSPIDQTAAAVCLLAMTGEKNIVFHPYNSHYQMLGDILMEMESIGKHISTVEDADFVEILNKAKSDPAKQEQLSAMLAYESKPSTEFIKVIPPDNSYTVQLLLRLGFRWSVTSWDYIDQFLHQIAGLDFFE